MSLDIYLTQGDDQIEECWNCHGTGKMNRGPEVIYRDNITHNLTELAEVVGLYQACWRPEEIGITKANQLIPLLRAGLEKLRKDPKGCRAFDSPSGWGTYDKFVPWVEKYLKVCEEHPEADVKVDR